MKAARLILSPELVIRALHLPTDAMIHGVVMNGGVIEMTLEHDGLKECEPAESEALPCAIPLFGDYHGRPVFRGWGQ